MNPESIPTDVGQMCRYGYVVLTQLLAKRVSQSRNANWNFLDVLRTVFAFVALMLQCVFVVSPVLDQRESCTHHSSVLTSTFGRYRRDIKGVSESIRSLKFPFLGLFHTERRKKKRKFAVTMRRLVVHCALVVRRASPELHFLFSLSFTCHQSSPGHRRMYDCLFTLVVIFPNNVGVLLHMTHLQPVTFSV